MRFYAQRRDWERVTSPSTIPFSLKFPVPNILGQPKSLRSLTVTRSLFSSSASDKKFSSIGEGLPPHLRASNLADDEIVLAGAAYRLVCQCGVR